MSSLDALRFELQPILGDATNSVVSRLTAGLAYAHAQDEGSSSAADGNEPSDRSQANRALAKLDEFRDEFERLNPYLKTQLVDGANAALFLDFYGNFRRAVRELPSPDGRPRDALRRAVLDDIVFALEAAGLPAAKKTRGGLLEQTARIVLPACGDSQLPVDMGRWLFEAVDRYHQHRGVITPPDSQAT